MSWWVVSDIPNGRYSNLKTRKNETVISEIIIIRDQAYETAIYAIYFKCFQVLVLCSDN